MDKDKVSEVHPISKAARTMGIIGVIGTGLTVLIIVVLIVVAFLFSNLAPSSWGGTVAVILFMMAVTFYPTCANLLFPFGALALVLGIVGYNITVRRGLEKGRTPSVIGIVLGIIVVGFFTVIFLGLTAFYFIGILIY